MPTPAKKLLDERECDMVTVSRVDDQSGVRVLVMLIVSDAKFASSYTPLVSHRRRRPASDGLRVAVYDRSTMRLLRQLYTPDRVTVAATVCDAPIDPVLLGESGQRDGENTNVVDDVWMTVAVLLGGVTVTDDEPSTLTPMPSVWKWGPRRLSLGVAVTVHHNVRVGRVTDALGCDSDTHGVRLYLCVCDPIVSDGDAVAEMVSSLDGVCVLRNVAVIVRFTVTEADTVNVEV